mmetsp:Transcript_19759/g.63648  ORF Transcript_19759/g.63648 Transcript_19759/m.63648 type:complete len:229 (+) Transcript_19759:532-1218(+)
MRERMCSTCAFDRKPSKRQTPAEGASSTPFVAPTGASGVLLLVEPEASIGSSETQSSASGNGSAHHTGAPPPPHVRPTELTVESASEPSPTMAAPVVSPKEASSASAAAPMGFRVVGAAAREAAPLNLEMLNGMEKVGWKVPTSGQAPNNAPPPPRTSWWSRSSAALLGLREADAARASAGTSVSSWMWKSVRLRVSMSAPPRRGRGREAAVEGVARRARASMTAAAM